VHRSAFRFGGCYTPDASSAAIRDIAFWVNNVMHLKTLVSTTGAVFLTATNGAVAAAALTAGSADLTRRPVAARGPSSAVFATLLSTRIWQLNRGG
jgi:hypothetical protein